MEEGSSSPLLGKEEPRAEPRFKRAHFVALGFLAVTGVGFVFFSHFLFDGTASCGSTTADPFPLFLFDYSVQQRP
jgi:hypothetical protein